MKNDQFSKPYSAIPKNVNNVQLPQIPVPMCDRPVFGGENEMDYNYRITQRDNDQRRNDMPVNAAPTVSGN